MYLLLLHVAVTLIVLVHMSPTQVYPWQSIEIIDSIPGNGSAVFDAITTDAVFDSSKVHHPNTTSYDWWYFDAVAGQGNASLVILFVVSPQSVYKDLPTVLQVQISGSFANGTSFQAIEFAEKAIVSSGAPGTKGQWKGAEAGWVGSSDMSKYEITLSLKRAGIEGTFTLQSVCTPDPTPHKPW
jgi:hypothetical protein